MPLDRTEFQSIRELAYRHLRQPITSTPLNEEESQRMAYCLLAAVAELEHMDKNGKWFPQHWSGWGVEWACPSKEVGDRIDACLSACKSIPQPILKAMVDSDKVKILLEIMP